MERGLQIKSFTQGDNIVKAENAEFPVLCENCLGETPYVRMQKIPFGGSCKMCERPFTLFKWRPGRGDAYKMTQICQTCSKVKNLCQTCILDLQYGLPSQLRDAVLSRADDETLAIPESEVNLEYQNQQQIAALTNGLDPWASGETPNEKLLRLARNSTVHRDPSRIKLLPKPDTNGRETDIHHSESSLEKAFDSLLEYIPSDSFLGSRNGYVFTMGVSGLGYYIEESDQDFSDKILTSSASNNDSSVNLKSKEPRKKKTKFTPKPPSGPPPPWAFEKN